MRRIHRFFLLCRDDKSLFIQSMALIAAFRVGLNFLSLKRILWLIDFSSQSLLPKKKIFDVDKITWAIVLAGNTLPGGRHCLSKALAAHFLLQRHGKRSEMHIGVDRANDGNVVAHAWVDCDGKVVLGNCDDFYRFVPLAKWGRN